MLSLSLLLEVDVNKPDFCGDSPLMKAFNNCNTDIVMLLLNHKNIDITLPDANGDTILYHAYCEGSNDIINIIRARFNIQSDNSNIIDCNTSEIKLNTKPSLKKKKTVIWDNKTIDEQHEERIHNPRKKIDEPKTPYHINEDENDSYSQKLIQINKLQPTVIFNYLPCYIIIG